MHAGLISTLEHSGAAVQFDINPDHPIISCASAAGSRGMSIATFLAIQKVNFAHALAR